MSQELVEEFTLAYLCSHVVVDNKHGMLDTKQHHFHNTFHIIHEVTFSTRIFGRELTIIIKKRQEGILLNAGS